MDIKIIAHRGASYYAPENTIAAFYIAQELQADGIELDVHLTKDNKLVVIHDKTTERTGDKNVIVSKATLEELKAIDVGSWFGPQFKGEKIPTLEEVINKFRDLEIYIEIKSGKEAAFPLFSALEKVKEKERLMVFSFDYSFLLEWQKFNKNVRTLWIVEYGYNISEDEPIERIIEKIEHINLTGISTDSNLDIWEKHAFKIVSKKLYWNVWTIDDEDIAKKFSKMGVNSITTNIPDKIRKVLKGKNF
ncbi:glycerophosphodiester phosphodiesterase [Thermodesulfatator indicus]